MRTIRPMHAQVAMEYLIIIGMVMIFLIPIWNHVANVQRQTGSDLAITYARNVVEKVADTADLVYSQGEPAMVNVKVYIPAGVVNYSLTNSTVLLKMRTESGVSDVFAISMAELNGTLPTYEGTYWIKIEAKDSMVQIDKV